MTQLVSAYATGDINKITSLFTEGAQFGAEIGREKIRAEYLRLFTNTRARTLVFEGMQWRRSGNTLWLGTGNFEEFLIDQSAATIQHQLGSTILAVRVINRQLKISEFTSTVDSSTESKAPAGITRKKLEKITRQLTRPNPDKLIKQFIQAYEQGDLALFSSLFSSNAKTNKRQGQENIRQEYRSFFADSSARKLHIKHMQWQQSIAGTLLGKGAVEVEVRTGGLNLVHRYKGWVQFRLKTGKEGLRIAEFYYQVQ